MKRLFFSLALILCLLLCACAAEPKESTDLPSSEPESTAAETTEAETEAPTEKPTETEVPTEKPTETEAPTEAAPVLKENSAFLPYETDGGNSLGVIVNDPLPSDLKITDRWVDGDVDIACIIPRYAGSRVSLFRIEWDEEGGSSYVLENFTDAEDGCTIYGALFRPEGMPMWYVEIETPDGRVSGLTLYYNGNTGTPPLEFID